MPTEHEFKTVFRISQQLHEEVKSRAKSTLTIKQGYLAFNKGMSARVRYTECEGVKAHWSFTFKQKVGNRPIEIEKKKLLSRDGEDLWSASLGKITKIRYEIPEGDFMWEFDFFVDPADFTIYFVMSEVECEENELRPSQPSWAENYVLFEPELDDDRFANKKLSDVVAVKSLYRGLIKSRGDNEISDNQGTYSCPTIRKMFQDHRTTHH